MNMVSNNMSNNMLPNHAGTPQLDLKRKQDGSMMVSPSDVAAGRQLPVHLAVKVPKHPCAD